MNRLISNKEDWDEFVKDLASYSVHYGYFWLAVGKRLGKGWEAVFHAGWAAHDRNIHGIGDGVVFATVHSETKNANGKLERVVVHYQRPESFLEDLLTTLMDMGANYSWLYKPAKKSDAE